MHLWVRQKGRWCLAAGAAVGTKAGVAPIAAKARMAASLYLMALLPGTFGTGDGPTLSAWGLASQALLSGIPPKDRAGQKSDVSVRRPRDVASTPSRDAGVLRLERAWCPGAGRCAK